MKAVYFAESGKPILRRWFRTTILPIGAWFAWQARMDLPAAPFFGADSYGYFAPAFQFLEHGDLVHIYARSFPYPAFLALALFKLDMSAISFAQHLSGIVGGVLLLYAWYRAVPAPRSRWLGAIREILAYAMALLFWFNSHAIQYEHFILREALSPAVTAFLLALGIALLRTRDPGRAGVLAAFLLFATVGAAVYQPRLTLLIIPALLLIAWRLRLELRRLLWVLAIGLACGGLAWVLPERMLAADDPASEFYTAETFFMGNSRIIAPTLRSHAADPQSKESSDDRAFLAELARRIEKTGKEYPSSIGANPVWLTYDSPGPWLRERYPNRSEYREFLWRWVWRGIRENPGAYAQKVAGQLARGLGFSAPVLAPLGRFDAAGQLRHSRETAKANLSEFDFAWIRDYLAELQRDASEYNPTYPGVLRPLRVFINLSWPYLTLAAVLLAGYQRIRRKTNETPLPAAEALAFAFALAISLTSALSFYMEDERFLLDILPAYLLGWFVAVYRTSTALAEILASLRRRA